MKKSKILIIVFIIVSSCLKLPEGPADTNNPLDPNNPNYVPPQVTITEGPSNEDIISEDLVTFSWIGNQENMEFRYRINNEEWSGYSTTSSATIDFLDDGDHVFQVQGKYPTGVEGDRHDVLFTVDAIKAPALFLVGKRNKVLTGESFTLSLEVELDDSVSIIYTKMDFDPDALQVDSVVYKKQPEEAFLLKNGGELITFEHFDNTTGTIELDCAVYQGNPRNVSGSGSIANIYFSHIISTGSLIQISEDSKCRDSENSPVTISYFGSAKVILR